MTNTQQPARRPGGFLHDRVAYKWIVLSCTTLGVLVAMINASSLLIALPAIFRGIKLDPLDPGNFTYLLWILMGYGLVSAALVVTAGRIGDMFGRVRMFKIGFVVFTLAAVGLSLVWSTGAAGAVEIIVFRMVQAVGGAMMMANSAAIITDAFPHDQRGMALGINGVSLLAGSFIGLIAGGVLAAIDWRLVFVINVPVGLLGIVWAFWQLREIGERHPARIDWLGNLTFAAGLAMVLTGITYGIKPYGSSNMGWADPFVMAMIAGGVAAAGRSSCSSSCASASRCSTCALFRIRAFAAGNLAVVLSSMANSGMQFMLIMWLQGIWLPLHGYSFESTPLWAGIYMLPLTAGFLVAGPVSGILSDRYGARPFATGGMLLAALSFLLLMALPADFAYWLFALVHLPERLRLRHVRGAQHGGHHEQRAGARPGRRLGHARHLPDAGPAALHRHLLLAHGGGPHGARAGRHAGRAHRPARARPGGHAALAHAAHRLPVRRLPGLQPAQAAAGPARARRAARGRGAHPGRQGVLPAAHRGAVQERHRRTCCCSPRPCASIAALASWMRGGKFVHEEAHATHAHQRPAQGAPHGEAQALQSKSSE